MVEMEILKRGRRENNPRKGRESGYVHMLYKDRCGSRQL